MEYFSEEFKNRVENLINNSFIPMVLGIKKDTKEIVLEYLDTTELEKLLEERIEHLENIISAGWLERMSDQKRKFVFYNLNLELEEAKILLEEHRKNIEGGIYFS